ncbi:hypothetical protein CLOM_g11265, partial [Closterium sp. NIES-68]
LREEEEDEEEEEDWEADRTIWPMDQKLLAIWLEAMGSALVVSLCSLICLTLLPLVCYKGKLPRALVDGLAAFGAGAMLGDAFLHQLPHAFGSGSHSHNHTQSHDHGHAHPHGHGHESHSHDHGHDHGHEEGGGGHAHSIEDLSVGIAVLVGIVLFFLVEKIVRRVEELTSQGGLCRLLLTATSTTTTIITLPRVTNPRRRASMTRAKETRERTRLSVRQRVRKRVRE